MAIHDDQKETKSPGAAYSKLHRQLIFVSFLAGVIWFVALSSDDYNHKTYFSENALLPGLVNRGFNSGSRILRTLESLKEETRQRMSMPYAWIQAQFRQCGLDVYTHNFTLTYPFGSQPRYTGNNIFAILRAPRASGTEAVVLSTPFRGENSIHESTLPSIALMIELARYFRQFSYWSKDIIFLVTEHENIGFQAWLNAYHGVSVSSFLDSGSLDSRSGPIHSAMNLEITTDKFAYIDIKIQGLNGQLPNLDFFNLAVELCTRESVPSTFHLKSNDIHDEKIDKWEGKLKTMLSMMSLQATGLPSGAHGLFHRFGIQALTFTSGERHEKIPGKVSLVHFGKALEGIFRSLNNLLEKFHQSFFFYLLPSAYHYVSIGVYMPPFVLIAMPLLIRAFYLYLETRLVIVRSEDLNSNKRFSVWMAYDIMALSHTFGLILYLSPNFVNMFRIYFEFSSGDSLYCIHCMLLSLFLVVSLVYSRAQNLSKHMCYVKLAAVLLKLACVFYSLSLVNISMATFLSLLYVPVSVMIGCSGKCGKVVSALLILLHPFIVTFIGILAHSFLKIENAVWYEHLWYAFEGHKKVLLYTVEDMYFYQNWNYKIVTFALIPLWHELWILSCNRHAVKSSHEQ